MATREEYERRFLAVCNTSLPTWDAMEALAREVAAALAELAPAEQTEPPKAVDDDERWRTDDPELFPSGPQPATPPAPAPAVASVWKDGSYRIENELDAIISANDPEWLVSIPISEFGVSPLQGHAPTAVVMGRLEEQLSKACEGIDGLDDVTNVFLAAARADQRAAVEAECAPLRARVRELEEAFQGAIEKCEKCNSEFESRLEDRCPQWLADDVNSLGLFIGDRHNGEESTPDAAIRIITEQDKRIAALEAELAEARKGGAK